MKINSAGKGFLLALVSLFAISNVYIFSKAALQDVSVFKMGFWWFSFALIWILIYIIKEKTYLHIPSIPKKIYLIFLFLGILEIIDTYFFFKAINSISNPSVVAFIGNIAPAFAILATIIVFKERFNIWESIGIILAVIGAFVISYKGNNSLDTMFVYGTQYILYSAIATTIILLIIKKNIQKVSPILLVLNRTIFLFLFFLMAVLLYEDGFYISQNATKNIVIGSLLGPFLAAITTFKALQYIPMSQKAIFDSARGLVIMIGAYLYFGKFPEKIALIGGLISIVGVLFIAYGKLKLSKKD